MEAKCFCLKYKSLWRERFGCCLYPAVFASPSTVHPIRRSCEHLQWHPPPPYLSAGMADIVLNPISNETPPLTICFVFNKSARKHPHIPVAFRKGIYHSTVDQIWHTPSCAGIRWGGYTHTVDLLAWYTGHSKIKYVPWGISHLSWNCHKPIFTARTRRNRKKRKTQ